MAYLYHRVPHDMQGEVLYPLNQLRQKNPETYETAAAKYEGREWVMDQPVPFLDCLWNDVLYFSPVHPKHVKQVFESHGKRFRANRYFRIDSESLPLEDTVVYLHKKEFSRDKFNPDNWERFDPEGIEAYSELPVETVAYLEEKFASGEERPLIWIYTPHVMYRGTLDARELEVIEF